MPGEKVLQAIAVTAELTGTMLSEAAARVLLADLAEFSDDQLLAALTRCRKELKGRLTVADIIARIPGGHPTPEEAWSMVAHVVGDENETAVVTEPMLAAMIAADRLAHDKISAHKAFVEVYKRELAEAAPTPKWIIAAGWDAKRRNEAIERAVVQGKITEKTRDRALSNAAVMDAHMIDVLGPLATAKRLQ